MKFLLLPLLLLGAGAGYGLAPQGDTPAACDQDCRVTVECTGRDTCIVTCYDASGEVRCRQEVPCDGPCDADCDEPCAPGAEASKACVPGPACQR